MCMYVDGPIDPFYMYVGNECCKKICTLSFVLYEKSMNFRSSFGSTSLRKGVKMLSMIERKITKIL